MPHLHHGALGSAGSLLTMTLVFSAYIYLRGWFYLRSNALDAIPVWRACSFGLGVLLIWVAVASPLSMLDHELLTVHMIKHVLLMTIAPPMIWLGEPVRAWSQAFQQVTRSHRGVSRWRITIAKLGKALVRPEVCWLSAAAALVLWHIPPVFTSAMHSAGWHFVEQSSFLMSGLLFWWPVIQPWPSVPKPDLSMILYLFFATVPCDILSGFLVFCDRVIYPTYSSSSHLFGFTALGDQQCAAALMWTSVTLVYLVAGAILAMRLLSPQDAQDDDLAERDLPVGVVPEGVPQRLEAF
jgi:putative membrane protein